jgi:hypothetical protein
MCCIENCQIQISFCVQSTMEKPSSLQKNLVCLNQILN